MIRTLRVFPVLLLLGAQVAAGQEWATKMFDGLEHDFGVVARGSKVEHHFSFKNIYVEDVHVASVRSSCGCTKPTVSNETVKTYGESQIVAAFNTRDFLGQKSATITVVFDKPFYAEVQLQIAGYIRSDVVLRPSGVELGTIDQGAAVEKHVAIHYAGRSDWQILEVRTPSKHVTADLKQRSRQSGEVIYDLNVRLDKNAPAGYLKDQIVLVTNDSRAPSFPVDIEGRIVPQIRITPTKLFMGVMKPGQETTKQIIIQAKQPFLITDIRCDDDCFVAHVTEKSRPVQRVPITFTAGNKPGNVAAKIRIETDLGEASVPVVVATAKVIQSAE